MLRFFDQEIGTPDNFIVTLELVPGRQSTGRSVDTVLGIAKDAFDDGRISAVSITDNPGGNPSLSPDVLGHEIFRHGMDVIVHFTCRDMNRVGMESRALQLARLGMKNILALTGDYSGKGFGGQGKPVFDFDSVILTAMLKKLNARLEASGDPDGFFTGCAVSPFKTIEAECQVQYRKLDLKVKAGASFIITQLGYNVDKFEEVLVNNRSKGINLPTMASVYLLSPRSARAMNRGRVAGVHVSDDLFNTVVTEWEETKQGLKKAIDRTAKLGLILKGLGYRGIHIGGIHRNFSTVAAILDRMEEMENNWQDHMEEFKDCNHRYYFFFTPEKNRDNVPTRKERIGGALTDYCPYLFLKNAHHVFFNKESRAAARYARIATFFDDHNVSWLVKLIMEDPLKKLFLSCQSCGDCAIQHIGFQCPESGCPKYTRNGACGGSKDGYCEVNPDKLCIWVRAYRRYKRYGDEEKLSQSFVPPRLWALNRSSSWINFHLNRDHQGK